MQNFKRVVVLFGIVGLIGHFTATAIYVTEGKFTPYRLNYWVGKYMLPAFHQSWNVFAPEPPVASVRFYIRGKSNGSWTNWKDPGFILQRKHQRNRFSHYARQYYIQHRIMNQIEIVCNRNLQTRIGEGEHRYLEVNNSAIIQSDEFKLAAKYAEDALKKTFKPDSIEFAMVYFHADDFPNYSRTEERRMTVVVFPKLAINGD